MRDTAPIAGCPCARTPANLGSLRDAEGQSRPPAPDPEFAVPEPEADTAVAVSVKGGMELEGYSEGAPPRVVCCAIGRDPPPGSSLFLLCFGRTRCGGGAGTGRVGGLDAVMVAVTEGAGTAGGAATAGAAGMVGAVGGVRFTVGAGADGA